MCEIKPEESSRCVRPPFTWTNEQNSRDRCTDYFTYGYMNGSPKFILTLYLSISYSPLLLVIPIIIIHT